MADDRLLARIVRSGATRLVNGAVGKVLPEGSGDRAAPSTGPSLSQRIAHSALLRIAVRSVPGAIVVGGSLLARHLYLARKAKAAREAAADANGPEA